MTDTAEWRDLARQTATVLVRCEEREKRTELELAEIHGIVARIEGQLERHRAHPARPSKT